MEVVSRSCMCLSMSSYGGKDVVVPGHVEVPCDRCPLFPKQHPRRDYDTIVQKM